MEKDKEITYLYNRYLENTCTEEEMNLLLDLIEQEHPEVRDLMDKTWEEEEEQKPEEVLGKKRFRFSSFLSAAAVFILILGSILWFNPRFLNGIFWKDAAIQLYTGPGQYQQSELADGTKIWLSPNSKLVYPKEFAGAERMVTLEGEAFFEVKHDPLHPFIVNAGKVRTKVLGTSFNVSAYPLRKTIEVALLAGRVAVSFDGKEEHRISPGQYVSVDRVRGKMTSAFSPGLNLFLDRRLGLFAYKERPLLEVLADLETMYNVKIDLEQTLNGNQSFTGNLNMSLPIAEILNKLCMITELKWTKNGSDFILADKSE